VDEIIAIQEWKKSNHASTWASRRVEWKKNRISYRIVYAKEGVHARENNELFTTTFLEIIVPW